ncbi:MAG: hypothetical protein Q7S27_01930 [Nanoarchaeota archaeon]|nr:hypothetical protein [Nanoarchaeota archaeon]
MHLKRQETTTKLPIPRKGTKYVARALSHLNNSVPVVIAVRDMLKMARTTADVKKMIHQKLLKINGRNVRDHRESIKLFNLFEADKHYILSLLPTGKFSLEHAKEKDSRLCKVINKTLVKNNSIQLNFHDGSNILSKTPISVGDSLYLDLSSKIKKHLPLEKGKEVMIIKGKYLGLKGKVESLENNKITIKINDRSTTISKQQVVAI